MPVPLSEIRPIYPKEAKDKQVEGTVALDVLIDQAGKVRQVSVIEGPQVFRASALEAMKKFLFRPAKVDGKPVAVRIRYSLNFKLEF
jgi:protein TonB